MTWFWQAARRYPWVVLAVVALATVAAAFGAVRIRVVTDIREFFPQGDPVVETYREVNEKFGGMEYIMVALSAEDIFTPEVLQKLDRLTRAIQEVPGVRSVRSLTNIEEIRGAEGVIEVAPLVEELPRTPEEIEAFRRRVLSDDFYAGNFVSAQGRTALVMAQVAEGADPVEVSAAVRRVAREFEGPERVALAGSPTINEQLTKAIYQDLKRLFPLSAALVSLVLYLAFRSVRGVALPLATVLLSVVWTLGLMGFLGAPFSQASAMLPPLLVSVGSAYGIHMLGRYEEERRLGLGRSPGPRADHRQRRPGGLSGCRHHHGRLCRQRLHQDYPPAGVWLPHRLRRGGGFSHLGGLHPHPFAPPAGPAGGAPPTACQPGRPRVFVLGGAPGRAPEALGGAGRPPFAGPGGLWPAPPDHRERLHQLLQAWQRAAAGGRSGHGRVWRGTDGGDRGQRRSAGSGGSPPDRPVPGGPQADQSDQQALLHCRRPEAHQPGDARRRSGLLHRARLARGRSPVPLTPIHVWNGSSRPGDHLRLRRGQDPGAGRGHQQRGQAPDDDCSRPGHPAGFRPGDRGDRHRDARAGRVDQCHDHHQPDPKPGSGAGGDLPLDFPPDAFLAQ